MATTGITTEESAPAVCRTINLFYRSKYYKCWVYTSGVILIWEWLVDAPGFTWFAIKCGSPIFKQIVAKIKKNAPPRPQVRRIKITLHLKNDVETKDAYRYKRKRSNHKKKINKRRIKDAW